MRLSVKIKIFTYHRLPKWPNIYFCKFYITSFNVKNSIFFNFEGSVQIKMIQVWFCISIVISTKVWLKYAGIIVLKVSFLEQWREDRLTNSRMSSFTSTIHMWHHHKCTCLSNAGIIITQIQKWMVWDLLTPA